MSSLASGESASDLQADNRRHRPQQSSPLGTGNCRETCQVHLGEECAIVVAEQRRRGPTKGNNLPATGSRRNNDRNACTSSNNNVSEHWPTKVKVDRSGRNLSRDHKGNWGDANASKQTNNDKTNLDSGYAWLILAVMFLLQSSISGTFRVYGLIYAKQVDTKHYDREQASWPIATASAIENLASILTPALVQLFSWRQIELTAGSLFVISNFATYFSRSLALDVLFLGCLQGIALSMSTVLSLAINNDYFERYRTTAYGISMAGSTFGVLYLSPLVSWLLDTFDDFRLAYLALACVFCGNVILALFIKPRAETIPQSAAKQRRRTQSSSSKGDDDDDSDRQRRLQRKRLSESTLSSSSAEKTGEKLSITAQPSELDWQLAANSTTRLECTPGERVGSRKRVESNKQYWLADNGYSTFGSNLKTRAINNAIDAASAKFTYYPNETKPSSSRVSSKLDRKSVETKLARTFAPATWSSSWSSWSSSSSSSSSSAAAAAAASHCEKAPIDKANLTYASGRQDRRVWSSSSSLSTSGGQVPLTAETAETTGGGNCVSRLMRHFGAIVSNKTVKDDDGDYGHASGDNNQDQAEVRNGSIGRQSIASLSDWAVGRRASVWSRWSTMTMYRRRRRQRRSTRRAGDSWRSQVTLPVRIFGRPKGSEWALFGDEQADDSGASDCYCGDDANRRRSRRRKSIPFFTVTSGSFREHFRSDERRMRLESDVAIVGSPQAEKKELSAVEVGRKRKGDEENVCGGKEKFAFAAAAAEFILDSNVVANGKEQRKETSQQIDSSNKKRSGLIVQNCDEKFADFRLDRANNLAADSSEFWADDSEDEDFALAIAIDDDDNDNRNCNECNHNESANNNNNNIEDSDEDSVECSSQLGGASKLAGGGDAEFNLSTILDLLKSPYLHLTWLMLSLYYVVARVFAIILVDFALDHSLDSENARALLNYWSLGELCGRLLLGSLIDLRWISVRNCVSLTCFLLAASIFTMVAIESQTVYALCSAFVAALISLEYMLINVLLVESMGKQRVTGCYALAALISSTILFARPMLIGLFRDRLGSYDGLLLLLSAISLAIALLFAIVEPLCKRYCTSSTKTTSPSCN